MLWIIYQQIHIGESLQITISYLENNEGTLDYAIIYKSHNFENAN